MRPGVSWGVLEYPWVSWGVLGYPGVSWGNQTDPFQESLVSDTFSRQNMMSFFGPIVYKHCKIAIITTK